MIKAGVVGCPVAHSLSPTIHQYWMKQFDIIGEYNKIEITEGHFFKGIEALKKQNFAGVNVTIPHKINAFKIADIVCDSAQKCGSANTLYFNEKSGIIADNTDGYGFISYLNQHLKTYQYQFPEMVHIMILGAGGAARGVALALLEANWNLNLYIVNRN
ncbi:MAG: shikimate dehydrogenase, partial [Pseudomonadota bacterium]